MFGLKTKFLIVLVSLLSIGGTTGVHKVVDWFKKSAEEKQIKALTGELEAKKKRIADDSTYNAQLINEIGVLTDSLGMANFKLGFANKSTGDFQKLILAYRNQLKDCENHTTEIINASAGLSIDSVAVMPERKKKWWKR
jgi:hypothetical protein